MPAVSDHLQRHGKRLISYAGAQVLVQLINGVTGLILVHALSKNDYAWITITNSLLATISILSDSGLGSATTSMGGPMVNQTDRFKSLVHTTRSLRMLFALASAALVLPTGGYLLNKNSATSSIITLLLALTLLTAIPSADAVVFSTVNRLHSRLRGLVASDFILAGSRLVFVAVIWWLGATAILAAATTAAALWIQATWLRRQTAPLLYPVPPPTNEWRRPVFRMVGHMLPLCLFQCVQGHLTTWVLSIFATTSDVADVGALSRLSLIYTFFALPLTNIIAPAIARASNRERLRKLCLATSLGYAGISIAVVFLGALTAPYILWVLGAKYAHLQRELIWYLGFQSIGLVSTVLWGVTMTKGWIAGSRIHIPATVVIQGAAAGLLDLSSVPQALVFASISSLTGIIVCTWQMLSGIARSPVSSSAQACSACPL